MIAPHADKIHPLRILRIDASARTTASTTRALADELVETLRRHHGDIELVTRDVANGLPFVDEAWVNANFTDAAARNPAQRDRLAGSDALVRELQDADVLVIGVPIYNFGVPATLKAWVDQVARARLTFEYTAGGPRGLLRHKRAYLVVASGGTQVDSPIDFATPYLRHVLGFLGITEVEVIAADRQMSRTDAVALARSRIATCAAIAA
jgi:FMN-dependent NADH-azoreductase